MNTKDVKTAIDIINKSYQITQLDNVGDMLGYLESVVKEAELESARELKKRNTIEAFTYEAFIDYVEYLLDEDIRERTPHGEYGGSIEDTFYWNNRTWKCKYSPDWNRHDKQYYYIDNYGDNLKVEEII